MEKIIKIEEDYFKIHDGYYDGYIITTDQQTIKVGISAEIICCERFGYLTTNDDLQEFEGAELLSIAVVDTSLNSKKIEQVVGDLNYGDVMFINFETSVGTMQLVAYNSHNGYYGHKAVIISKQLNYSEII